MFAALLSAGRTAAHANEGIEEANKQVAVRVFADLVRYALRKTQRERSDLRLRAVIEKYCVTSACFNVANMNASLRAPDNMVPPSNRTKPSMQSVLERARQSPVIFHFLWRSQDQSIQLRAVFRIISRHPRSMLIRLLWLELPHKVPIARSAGQVNGRTPLAEAVETSVRVFDDGRIERFPPPR